MFDGFKNISKKINPTDVLEKSLSSHHVIDDIG